MTPGFGSRDFTPCHAGFIAAFVGRDTPAILKKLPVPAVGENQGGIRCA